MNDKQTPDQFAIAAYGNKIAQRVATEMGELGVRLISKDMMHIEGAIIQTITSVLVHRKAGAK